MLTLTDVRKRVKTGKAMLFCGAGFSINCLNLMDSPPLLAKDLAKAICKTRNSVFESLLAITHLLN